MSSGLQEKEGNVNLTQSKDRSFVLHIVMTYKTKFNVHMKKECSLTKLSSKIIFKTAQKSEIKTNKKKVSGIMKRLTKLTNKPSKRKNILLLRKIKRINKMNLKLTKTKQISLTCPKH